MIRVHIGKKGRNCGVEVLLEAVGFKSQIESLILNNIHLPIDQERQYWTQFDYAQEIRNMAVRQQKCLQYKIELTSERGGKNLLDAVAENGFFLPYFYQIKANRTTEQQFVSFVRAAHRFPHLQKLEITWSSLSDRAFFQIIQQSSKLVKLRKMNFLHNRITDEKLKALLENGHKFPRLQTIDLQHNKITNEGLEALFENGHKFPCLQQN